MQIKPKIETMQIKPKTDDNVIVLHEGELKLGKVIEVFDVLPGYSSQGLTFTFTISTKRKSKSPLSTEYINCLLTGNSFTLNPPVNANINWAPAKGVGSDCFVFYTKEEYEIWLKNEYKYEMDISKMNFEKWGKLYNDDINSEIISF